MPRGRSRFVRIRSTDRAQVILFCSLLLEIKPMFFIGAVDTGDNPGLHCSTGVDGCGLTVDRTVENHPGFPHPTGCPLLSTGYPPVIPKGYPQNVGNPGSRCPQGYPRIMERCPPILAGCPHLFHSKIFLTFFCPHRPQAVHRKSTGLSTEGCGQPFGTADPLMGAWTYTGPSLTPM
jgi:hypothetical protein